MTIVRLSVLTALAALAASAPQARAAAVFAQKGNLCSATWETGQASVSPNQNLKKPWTLNCTDGDPSCDVDGSINGSCAVRLSACALQANVACTPEQLTKFKLNGVAKNKFKIGLPDTSFANCGAPGVATLKLKGKKNKPPKPSAKLQAVINFKTTPGGSGKNAVIVQCQPNPECTALPCGGTIVPPPGSCLPSEACPNNPAIAGSPKQICFQVPLPDPATNSNASDLDTGYSGTSHNFPIVAGSTLRYCASNCDGVSDTLCDLSGETGGGTINTATFGAPLPLLSANVPVCVVNRFQPGPITGTYDVKTGMGGEGSPNPVNLFSDTYLRLSTPQEVCPRCNVAGATGPEAVGQTGACSQTSSTPGASCVVDGFAKVIGGPAGSNPNYTLSSSCLPPGDAQNPTVLDIPLRLTTGPTSSPPGPNPCPNQPLNDNCPANGVCNAGCTACAATGPNGECIDAKGGIAQLCCSTDSTKSCFPTKNGGVITRQGVPGTTTALFASNFCIPATKSSLINSTAGLPGPGALLLPADPITVLTHTP